MSIIGIGVDLCDTQRFARVVERTPRVIERLFTPDERMTSRGDDRSVDSLAGRFAVKEAVAKVLRDTSGIAWRDCEVASDHHGAPVLQLHNTAKDRAIALGIDRWHVSVSHDGGLAIAFVVAEGGDAERVSGR